MYIKNQFLMSFWWVSFTHIGVYVDVYLHHRCEAIHPEKKRDLKSQEFGIHPHATKMKIGSQDKVKKWLSFKFQPLKAALDSHCV